MSLLGQGQLVSPSAINVVSYGRPHVPHVASRLLLTTLGNGAAFPAAAQRCGAAPCQRHAALRRTRRITLIAHDQPPGSGASVTTAESTSASSLEKQRAEQRDLIIINLNDDIARHAAASTIGGSGSGSLEQAHSSQPVHQHTLGQEERARQDGELGTLAAADGSQIDSAASPGTSASSTSQSGGSTSNAWNATTTSNGASSSSSSSSDASSSAPPGQSADASSSAAAQAPASPLTTLAQRMSAVPWSKLWALTLCVIAYVHQVRRKEHSCAHAAAIDVRDQRVVFRVPLPCPDTPGHTLAHRADTQTLAGVSVV